MAPNALKSNKIKIGARIAAIRRKRELSQSGLARLAFGHARFQSRVANYEAGRREPKFADLQRLAEAMGVGAIDFYADLPLTLSAQRTIPVLSMDGNGMMQQQEQLPVFWPAALSAEAFAFVITDDRFAPVIQPGDCLIIDPSGELRQDDLVLIRGSTGSVPPLLAYYVETVNRVRRFVPLRGGKIFSLAGKDASRFAGKVISRIVSYI